MANGIASGYRLFDTAQRYENEEGVGKALRTAFSSGAVQRDEVFVTTKVWCDNMGADKTANSVRKSAKALGLDMIDLVLIHWPGQFRRRGEGDADTANRELRKSTWEALEGLQREGLCARIGVANYSERHLKELLAHAQMKPAVNQFEVHPYNTREALVELCTSSGIQVNSYCPLGGKGNKGQVTDLLLGDSTLKTISRAYGKTPAQAILRWHLQRGLVPIPKASSLAHLQENIDVFDFELTAKEMKTISALNRDQFALFDADALA